MRLKIFISIFSSIFLLSCAQIVPLSGGEKDETAPIEVESFPLNGSTNFAEKTIIIEFNEFIQLQNLASQLIISPLMENDPEITVKGKKLVIKLNDTLTANATYSFNFGNAITDITEYNAFPNYKYVFSIGDYLDSLSYSGTVINAEDLIPKEKIYVLLYTNFEDSVPFKEKPRYISITDKDGKYSITNIAAGKYKAFAINDINSNYLFDLPNEEVAFANELISLNKNSINNNLYLFEEENDIQFIEKTNHKQYGKIDVFLSNPSKELTITPLNKTFNEAVENWSMIEKNKTNDTISIWLLPNLALENLELEFKNENGIIDTVDVTLLDKKKFKDSTLTVTTNTGGNFDLNKNIIFTLNRPFVSYDSNNIKLYEDSLLIQPTLPFNDLSMRTFELAYDFKENMNYRLVIEPNTFEDLYGIKNDTIRYSFKTKKLADYGNIALALNPNFSESYILQLRKNKTIVQEDYFSGSQVINYQYLLPGDYSLRLIIDNNNDKNWTTGNYMIKQQPEKVILYEKEITIRANWDNDISWIIKE